MSAVTPADRAASTRLLRAGVKAAIDALRNDPDPACGHVRAQTILRHTVEASSLLIDGEA